MRRQILIGSFLALMTIGQHSNKASIYIYREAEFFGVEYKININQKMIAVLKPKSYIQVWVTAGEVSIDATTYRADKKAFQLKVEPGQTYYVKAYEEIDFWERHLQLQLYQEDKAKLEMKKCRENKDVKQPD